MDNVVARECENVTREGFIAGFPHKSGWVSFVSQVFEEEHVAYEVDSDGGVHPRVDVEFSGQFNSALRSLQGRRYEAVENAFGRAVKEMNAVPNAVPPHYKSALRDLFEAAETLAQFVTAKSSALTANFVDAELVKVANRVYSAEAGTRQVGPRLMSSFGKWVDAAHPYRHGHPTRFLSNRLRS